MDSTEAAMLRLYDSLLSGNSWKVRILLSQLHLGYERVTLDLAKGDTRRPDFCELSRFSRIPALTIEDGRTIIESAAILTFLAEGTDFLPSDSYMRAEISSWLFFEQADLQKAIAIPRVYHLRGQAEDDDKADEILHRQRDGYAALDHLENWIVSRTWLVQDRYTIADIAVSAYVSLASQGGYRMDRYPGIDTWLKRVKLTDRWVPLLEQELVAS
jgi:glutathione S-transferase